MSPARKGAARTIEAGDQEAVTTPLRSARTLRRKRAPKWTWQAIGAVAVVAVAGYLVWSAVKPTASTTRYVTATVTQGTLTVAASGNGNVVVGKASSVSPQVSGTVANLDIALGDKVTAGQKLFDIVNDQLDDQVTQALAQYRSAQSNVIKSQQSVTQAEAQVTQAESQLRKASTALDTAESNYASYKPDRATAYNNLKQAQLDEQSAEQNLTAAQQGVDAANSSLTASQSNKTASYNSYQQAQQTAAKRTVTAPISGVVTQLSVQNGDSLGGGSSSSSSGSSASGSSRGGSSGSSGSSGGSSSAAMVISDMSTLQAQVSVSEVDRASIKLGQKATLTFDALPNLASTGKVTEIDAVGTNSSGVITYNVNIAFDSIDPRISPGMTTAAAITTNVRTNVISVARSAVHTDSSGNSYVLVMPSGATTPQQVSVQTGVSTDTDTEITSGLKSGDVVVTQSINPNATTTGTGSSSNNRSGFGGFGGGMGGGGNVRVFRGGGGG